MDYQRILNDIYQEVSPVIGEGKVANYIPKLAGVPAIQFGMAVHTLGGNIYTIGDARKLFSIQSISKIFTLTLALKMVGEDALLERVGREPSGNPFNSLVQLEYENGIPRNPFINAGALVVADILLSNCNNTKAVILDFVRERSDNMDITIDPEVALSEKANGFRNAALANFLKSFNNLFNPVEEVLETYFSSAPCA